ncbi:hypothetical protein T4B_9590 [Trichinella pseudospiralis]|nr:hypothetical protein T4B_9590 [Trichinella pseudospiralis]
MLLLSRALSSWAQANTSSASSTILQKSGFCAPRPKANKRSKMLVLCDQVGRCALLSQGRQDNSSSKRHFEKASPDAESGCSLCLMRSLSDAQLFRI